MLPCVYAVSQTNSISRRGRPHHAVGRSCALIHPSIHPSIRPSTHKSILSSIHAFTRPAVTVQPSCLPATQRDSVALVCQRQGQVSAAGRPAECFCSALAGTGLCSVHMGKYESGVSMPGRVRVWACVRMCVECLYIVCVPVWRWDREMTPLLRVNRPIGAALNKQTRPAPASLHGLLTYPEAHQKVPPEP